MNQNKLHKLANTAGLVIICLILLIAFADQLSRHDLPCPLCLLQRAGFAAVGLCLCMNLKEGIRISHYGLMILAALLGFFASLRQISLHTAPGDPGYGHPLLGLPLYVWCAIAFMIIIGLIALGMLFERSFTEKHPPPSRTNITLMWIFLILILANGISTLIECSRFICPDNPFGYRLLS
jgi:disulfide bond formation protein DsbB